MELLLIGRCPKYNKNTLSTDFTKQEAVKQAQVLWIGYKTIDRWLQKSINCNEIQHVAHGKYSKTMDKIA